MSAKADLPTRADFPVITPVTLRFSDQDPMGHINNVATIALLESGRTGLLAKLFAGTDHPAKGMVLARLTVDYRAEIFFPGTVDVGAKLTGIGNTSMTSDFAIFQGDKCCVVSRSINVFVDPATHRPIPPTEKVRASLERHLVPSTGS